MKVWLYDPVTLRPTGEYECQESPLEQGAYIIPHCSLPFAPPAAGPNSSVFYNRADGWMVVNTPVPTAEDLLAVKVAQYRIAVRQHMSATAKNSPEHFNSISEAKSYASTVNPYTEVSKAFVNWSAAVLVASNAVLDNVLEGKATLPPVADLIESLPEWAHP
jgi:hypothetical protein